MDLFKAIEQLHEEKRRIDAVIQHLEALLMGRAVGDPSSPGKRGRKSMSEEERVEVSDRMKAYWANKRKPGGRKAKGAAAAHEASGDPPAD